MTHIYNKKSKIKFAKPFIKTLNFIYRFKQHNLFFFSSLLYALHVTSKITLFATSYSYQYKILEKKLHLQIQTLN